MLAVENLISIENLIGSAKKRGIDFGKGDPYNRLRYYTKIGWLPHMVRRENEKGTISGHYPSWILEDLILIEQLKSQGVSNDEISKKLQTKNRLQSVASMFTSKDLRTQFITYFTLFAVLIILANQFEIINLGKPKSQLTASTTGTFQTPTQIVDSGTAFVPKNQNTIFVRSSPIRKDLKVFVTFSQNYSPATRYWISEIRDYSGFILELDAPLANNTEFNWWVTN